MGLTVKTRLVRDVHKGAPLSEFEQVSSQFLVFRVVPRAEHGLPPDAHKDARR
jgi:hypothetical protein